MKVKIQSVIAISLLSVALMPNLGSASTKLAISKVKVISGKQGCGLINGKFVPVQILSKTSKQYSLKKITGSSSLKSACSSATKARNTLSSLSELPSLSKFISKKSNGASSIEAVSGTAPTLPEIANGLIDSIFWRPGVISALQSGENVSEACHEFFNSSTDGASGGFGACYMTQGVGRAFESVLRGASSACYMKHIPSRDNLTAGGISVVSGSIPGDDISKIFDTPSSRSRLIKINMSGRQQEGEGDSGNGQMMIRIASASSNSAAGNRYKAELFSCDPDSGSVQEYERMMVKDNGLYTSENFSQNGSFKLDAYLTAGSGELAFDTAQPRTATMAFSHGGDSVSKTQIVISSSNQLAMKSYDIFNQSEVRKAYTVARFSGASVMQLRFLSGAFKESNTSEGRDPFSGSGATEYRDTYYAAAPQSSLLDEVSDVSLSSGFYASAPNASAQLPNFNCSSEPDLEINLDMANANIQESIAPCEEDRLDNMDFCRSDALSQAQQGFFEHCMNQEH